MLLNLLVSHLVNLDAMMNKLEFDNETHTYRLNGTVLKSVTTIIKDAGLIDDRWFTEFSRWRGSAVHEAVFYDIHNDLDPNIHEQIKPYMEAWFKFKQDTKFQPFKHLCESRQYHPIYKYAGSPDLPGMLNGSPALIDIKTGDCPTAGLQTAAYAMFPKLMAYSFKRFSLRLRIDGTYRLNRHDKVSDKIDFLAALRTVLNQ
jgi:hypothetical protein